eukprot:TRINITY_DN6064_c0_g2_i3.p1 TRINITY_DN6064_c0_g2~~TRINITY_DN6064_c0_g2_i3.p1  ORF type:complete len:293 (+),score=73.87 TRINITY_DN6064_c0_g2_i3:148-1026(+)
MMDNFGESQPFDDFLSNENHGSLFAFDPISNIQSDRKEVNIALMKKRMIQNDEIISKYNELQKENGELKEELKKHPRSKAEHNLNVAAVLEESESLKRQNENLKDKIAALEKEVSKKTKGKKNDTEIRDQLKAKDIEIQKKDDLLEKLRVQINTLSAPKLVTAKKDAFTATRIIPRFSSKLKKRKRVKQTEKKQMDTSKKELKELKLKVMDKEIRLLELRLQGIDQHNTADNQIKKPSGETESTRNVALQKEVKQLSQRLEGIESKLQATLQSTMESAVSYTHLTLPTIYSV